MKKELKRVLAEATDRGWDTTLTRNGHWKLTHPNGGLVFTGSTPSDHRAVKNTVAQIRRCELAWAA